MIGSEVLRGEGGRLIQAVKEEPSLIAEIIPHLHASFLLSAECVSVAAVAPSVPVCFSFKPDRGTGL